MFDGDSFISFIFYLLVVSPSLAWILSPGRFSKQKRLIYAISFLIVLAGISVAYQISNQESNFYQVLGVNRDCSLSDLKKAYRARSIELHPDKNPSTTASEQFNRARIAFETLSDTDKRAQYDMFGEEAVNGDSKGYESAEVLTQIMSFYLVWGVLSYFLTLGGDCGEAPTWIFIGLIIMLVSEINIKFGNVPIPLAILPKVPAFQIVALMRSLFPAFMNGAKSIGIFIGRNREADNFYLSIEILKTNKIILTGMRSLEAEIQTQNRKKTGTSEIRDPLLEKQSLSKGENITAPATTTDNETSKEEEKVDKDGNNLEKPSAIVQSLTSYKIPNFVYFIGMYIILHYVFG